MNENFHVLCLQLHITSGDVMVPSKKYYLQVNYASNNLTLERSELEQTDSKDVCKLRGETF